MKSSIIQWFYDVNVVEMMEVSNNMPEPLEQKKMSQQDVIRLERDLAKYANMMDSVVRIPFTKQGVGADAALSTVPIAGDIAGFALTCYAIYKAKQIGVPQEKLALRCNLPVYFVKMNRLRRGRYEMSFELIYDGKEEVAEYEITQRYVRKLERMICECPELWMWSHRRWKHKRTHAGR
jgi:hypothetical protein